MADTNWSGFTPATYLADTDILLAMRGAGGVNALAELLAYKASDGVFKAKGNGLAISNDLSSFTFNGAQVPNYGIGVYSNIVTVGGYAGLKFHAGQAERLTIMQGGNVGVGTSSPTEKLDVAGNLRLSGNSQAIRMTTSNSRGWRMGVTSAGTDIGRLYFQGTIDNFTGSFVSGITIDSTSLRPENDNVTASAAAGYRWSVVYAATSAISTSDEREKVWIGIREDSRAVWLRIASRIFDELGFYQWTEAVDEKGAAARMHFGARAQRVWQIVADEGLAPPLVDGLPVTDWAGPPPPAFLCFDEWEAEHVEEPVYAPTLVGEDGEPLKTGTRTVVSRAAGNRFGFRTDQLNLLLVWSLRAGRV